MARSVFFSFYFDRDSWRVGQVRNSNVIKEFPKSTYFRDKAAWETVKRKGDPVATRHHLVLVPHRTPRRRHLDPQALVPPKEHPELPGRPRRTLWAERITAMTGAGTPDQDNTRNLDALLDTLAYAA
jgi:hypothetical protein